VIHPLYHNKGIELRSDKLIGIITLQNSNNYGAMYQVYALSKYLESLGHEVFVLDYEMTRDKPSLAYYLRHAISVLQKVHHRKMFSLSYFKRSKQLGLANKREKTFGEIFENFRKQYLKITNEQYDYKKLEGNCPKADAYICGSDQVWAADFLFTSPAFLLGFVPGNIRKIAYAPSFGKNQLEPYLRYTFNKFLKKFDAISVREKKGLDIVKSVAGQQAIQVLDPTLLLNKEDYVEIIDYSLVPNKPYIFVYRLGQEELLSNWVTETINEISLTKKLPIHVVSTNSASSFGEAWVEMTPTPGQLLGLIEKSSMTLTNSFHGTVFAIILKAEFLSFARDSFEDKQNVRMTDLLSTLGIPSLYCPPFTNFERVIEKLNDSNCPDETLDRLRELKQVSGAFLKDALG